MVLSWPVRKDEYSLWESKISIGDLRKYLLLSYVILFTGIIANRAALSGHVYRVRTWRALQLNTLQMAPRLATAIPARPISELLVHGVGISIVRTNRVADERIRTDGTAPALDHKRPSTAIGLRGAMLLEALNLSTPGARATNAFVQPPNDLRLNKTNPTIRTPRHVPPQTHPYKTRGLTMEHSRANWPRFQDI